MEVRQLERRPNLIIFRFFFPISSFPGTSPRGAFIWRGDLTEGFLRYRFGGLFLEGLIHGGACFGNIKLSQKREVSVKDTEGVPDEKQNVACCRLRD